MKTLLRVGGAIVAVLLVAAIAVPFLVDANTFRPALETQLTSAMGRPVHLGDLKLSLFSGAVEARDLSIEKFLEAKSVKIGVEMMPLIFSRKLNVTRVVIEEPRVTLAGMPTSESKTEAKGAGGQPMDVTIRLLKISNGRVDAGGGLVLDQLDLTCTEMTQCSLSGRCDLAGTGRGGIVTLKADATSDGKTAHATGKIRGEKLKLAKDGTPSAKPVEFDFAADHNLEKNSGRLTEGNLHIGSAVASLTGTYGPTLHLTLKGDNLAVTELAGILPSVGVVLPAGSSLQSGTATVQLVMIGPADRLVTSGNLLLNKVVLGGFDLGKKMAVLETLTGIQPAHSTEIQTFTSIVRMAPEGATADKVQLVVTNIGEIAGAGTVSPSNALDFKMTAKVANQSVPFLVQGTAADPSIRPDVKSFATEKAKGVASGLLNRFLGGAKK
jgi:AsmA protein